MGDFGSPSPLMGGSTFPSTLQGSSSPALDDAGSPLLMDSGIPLPTTQLSSNTNEMNKIS
ncbi:hypothetical protein TIFTF001_037052 [Ficus carica]|uniref:Uncharacterized protein n=1 Tax=Ficus carica TaxID=3494 RepID=A0AA88E4J5_FICCA|nr:hypothetical protein TIFTF001_037027 [Ficus carica]GMN67971.1 hypothetical protein TIFTF001_037031 [Ficus carica]GMN67987.1 hypothetical protein TIFTF001_037047 [Ficus carica]GMN67992.1 hypothetical protein TIFTF001_037052 [Ficus carica]